MTLLPQLLPILTLFLAQWIHKVALVVALKKLSAGNGVAAHFTLAALLGKSIVRTVEVDVGWRPSELNHITWR